MGDDAVLTDDKPRKKSKHYDDDAIIVEEDDAIVADDDAVVAEKLDKMITKPSASKKAELSAQEKAIVTAAKQKPLWLEEDRHTYTQAGILALFVQEAEIDFNLFDNDYMSSYEVFASSPNLPFNKETDLMAQVDVKRFQDKNAGAKGRTGAKGSGKDKQWQKPDKKRGEDEDDEDDPEWIEFEIGKDRTKFLGHVMDDEDKIREAIVKRKENKIAKAEERKKKFVEQAMNEGMTEEQRKIIAESKD